MPKYTFSADEEQITVSVPEYDGAYDDAKERASIHFDVDESELTELTEVGN